MKEADVCPRMLTNGHELVFFLPARAIRGWQAKAIALRHGRKTTKLLSRNSGMKLSGLRSAGRKMIFFIRAHS
jgi:hypothetical protein